ncbi:MAG: hypothetical protein COA58_15150 [Bacteroidetes bacterium]|nr:MAG: hypothetical protein COA58_15150 [Bacteroidota bacterium]
MNCFIIAFILYILVASVMFICVLSSIKKQFKNSDQDFNKTRIVIKFWLVILIKWPFILYRTI